MYCRNSATCVPYLLTVTVMEQYVRHWKPCRLFIWFFPCLSAWNSFSAGRISHSKKKRARCDQKCTRYSCHILMKLEISRHFRKIFGYQILWKSVQWKPSCSMRTDRRDEVNSRFSQFCESAKKKERKKERKKNRCSVSDQSCREIKTHILCAITFFFFENLVPFVR